MVNNADWLDSINYLAFLRDYGRYFTINRMLSFESVKQRLAREQPLTFLEFNYMLLQSYDFLELYRRRNAVLQLGGSDQWGNIVSGVELGEGRWSTCMDMASSCCCYQQLIATLSHKHLDDIPLTLSPLIYIYLDVLQRGR